jgi:serine/threonine protein kinase
MSASTSRKQLTSPASARKLQIQNSIFTIQKELGKGSFGVVFAGTDDETDESVAIKDIACKSDKELEQAKFEFEVMRKLQDKLATTSPRRGNAAETLHCPKFFAMQPLTWGRANGKSWAPWNV